MKKIRVLHVSSAHPPQDPRIVQRVVPSLTTEYDLTVLLPHVQSGTFDGIRYLGLPYFQRVLARLLLVHPIVFLYVLRIRPTLLHIYDPELIPVARLLQRLLRIPVIYEVHENFYKKLDQKVATQGRLATYFFRLFDAIAQRCFHLIFTEHAYLATYQHLGKPSAVVYNYPLLQSLDTFQFSYNPNQKAPEFVYIGLISTERAIDTLAAALAVVKRRYPLLKVHLFGRRTLTDKDLEKLPGFSAVRENLIFYGYTEQRQAFPLIRRATAGIALLKSFGDYPESYPTKVFEYMALSLPVITSDFPLYRSVVSTHSCGFCLSPESPEQLADALIYLVEHPAKAEIMGKNGRKAVETVYNWETERLKLLNLYSQILKT
ncbi:glycosyltransferase family 4 protein [Spirosoma pomorum]